MSKLCVVAATRVLAREYRGTNLRVNCCCPGFCNTDMSSHMGPRPPEDGARNAVLLCAEDCDYHGDFIQNEDLAAW